MMFLLPRTPFCTAKQKDTDSLASYDITHYTDENGLPQNSVKSIVSDSIGNIWLATEGGLARFDGRHFTIFDDFGSSNAYRSIASFHPNPVSANNGFFAINNEGTYIHITQGQAIRDDSFYKKQLLSQPFTDRTMSNVYIAHGLPSLDDDPDFHTLDNYVVVTGLDRYFIYNEKNVDYYIRKKKAKSASLPNKNFLNFFRLDNDLYYVEDGVFTRYAGKGASFEQQVELSGDILHHRLYSSKQPRVIFWKNCSNQVFILLGKSLYALHATADERLTSELILEGFDFNANKIKAVYYDRKAQRIFLGSLVNGLYVIKRKPFQAFTANFKGTDNVYYGQALLDSSSILSSQGVVFSLNPTGNKMSVSQLEQITRLVGWDKSSILVDRTGRTWCKRRNSLYLFQANGNGPKKEWDLTGEITQLYEGKGGKIWVGTRFGGLYHIDPAHLNVEPGRLMLGHLRNISWIQEQSSDVLWVATGTGLYKVFPKSKKVIRIKGLKNIYIRSLHIPEGKNEIWITTYKDGLFLLKSDRLTHFPLDKHKYLASAHCIVEDRKGFIWITTNKGLLQVLKKDLLSYAAKPADVYYHYYSKADGFNTNEFNGGCQACAVRLPTGHVSLPSMNGLIWFKPEDVLPELPDKSIIIDRAEINGKKILFTEDKITFRQDQIQLRLHVTTPYFGSPNNIHFSYALTKRNATPSVSEWLDIEGADGVINISQLTKGNYTLHVRKKNGFQTGNYEYKALTITVPPLWHETWWFHLLSGLALLLMAFAAVQIRFRSIKKRNAILESQVSDRTKALKEALDSLEESQSELLSQMHLQSRLMASIAHDVRTPLVSTIVVAGEMRKMIIEQQYDHALVYGKNVEDAMHNIKNSLEELLAYVKIQVYKREIKKEDVTLFGLIEKNFQLYGKTIKNSPNTFVNAIPQDVTVFTSPQLLDIIIHNLVDNANKFTNKGTIKAYIQLVDQAVNLIIEDSGKGMPAELLNWFANPGSNSIPESYHGIGLVMVKELAPIVGAGLSVECRHGTRITLRFPQPTLAISGQNKSITSRQHSPF